MSLRTAIFLFILMCIRYFGFGAITLKEMNASMKDGVAVIDWVTSTELNNKKFIVEKSSNCEHFYAIGTLEGETNSVTEKGYSFSDTSPLTGISYYRIVSVDNSGNATTSGLLIIDNKKSVLSNKIFPCPFREELNVVLNEEELPANSKLIVYGSTGREIYRCDAALEMKLDLSHLEKGTYYVAVENNNNRLMEKKVLKNEN